MEFNNRTKISIENAMIELLQSSTFKKITVQNILDHCGCSRPTFYYHFRDKYDVVSSVFDRMISPTLQLYPEITWLDMVTKLYDKWNENISFARKTIAYDESSPILANIIEKDIQIYENWLKNYAGLQTINDSLRFQIRFHSIACAGVLAYWIHSSPRRPSSEMAMNLLNAMPHELYELLPNKK